METIYDFFLVGLDAFTVLLGIAGIAGSFLAQRSGIGARFAPFLMWLRIGLALLIVSFVSSVASTFVLERHHLFELVHHLFFVLSAGAITVSLYSFWRLIR